MIVSPRTWARCAGAALFAIALAVPRVAHADPRAITLAEAQRAVRGAPAQVAEDATADAAAADAQAQGGWPASTVSLATTRATARFIAAASIPLPITGTLTAAREEGAASARAARSDADASAALLRREVTAAWLELARSEALAAIAVDAAGRAGEVEHIAQARRDAGDGAEADVVAAQAARIRAAADAAAAADEIAAASAGLAGSLGWDPAIALTAAGGVPAIAPVPPVEPLRAGLADHPEARAGRARIAAAEAAVRGAERARWPGIALDVEVDAHDATLPGTDARIGVSFDLPLFGRLGARAAAARSATRARTAEARAIDAALAGRLELAHRRWLAATRRARSMRDDVLPIEERSAALARVAFKEGARDLTTVLEAERALLAVKAEVVDAAVGAALAQADAEQAAGRAP
jgi:outer membrane protein TolC